VVDEVGGVDETDHPDGAVHESNPVIFQNRLYGLVLTGCGQ
jgi:hypothetical protein